VFLTNKDDDDDDDMIAITFAQKKLFEIASSEILSRTFRKLLHSARCASALAEETEV